jgi:hypothetical protein
MYGFGKRGWTVRDGLCKPSSDPPKVLTTIMARMDRASVGDGVGGVGSAGTALAGPPD